VVITLPADVPEVASTMRLSPRQIPGINVRVWRETWLVFPPDEKVLQASNGDPKNFQQEYADAGHHVVEIKPALEDRVTNMHVLTDKGSYSFVLREISSCKTCRVDLKVFVERDGHEEVKQQEDAVADLTKRNETLLATVRLTRQQAAEVAEEATAAKRISAEKAERSISAFKKEYPASQRCDYEFAHNKAPFEVGAICTDGTFTYVFSRSQGVQTIYAQKPDGVSLVQFDYARGSSNHDGVYIINGIITRGYLQAGKKKRLKFQVKTAKAEGPALQASR
jgi:type IV secretory pathway VirB9-like protein